MMSVIGGSIKKQIFFSLGLFFSCSQLGAMCPQTVGPVSIAEGMFNILLRVAQAQNVIQSQICAIDCDCSLAITVTDVTVVCSTCTTGLLADCIQFGQSDIGAGGVYIINSPGVYCMYQDANWTAGTAITVNSNDVTIDMQDHTLDGGNSGVSGIVINGGLRNITIKNGNINNPTSACIANNNSALTLQDLIIRDMNFNIINGALSHAGVVITAPSSTDIAFANVLIEDCTGYNAFINLNPGASAVVRRCILTIDLTGLADITISGPNPVGLGESFVVEDCILKNIAHLTAPAGEALFSIRNTWAAVINNCISYGSGGGGFSLNNCYNATVSNCVAQLGADRGFTFTPGPGGFPPSQQAKLSVTGCIAQECFYGFVVQYDTVGFASTVFKNCIAQANTQDGFWAHNSALGTFVPITCRNCEAEDNGNNGFHLGDAGLGFITGWLLDCLAVNNGANGFFFDTSTSMVIDMSIVGCQSNRNVNDGYLISATAMHNYFEECLALANGFNGFEDDSGGTSSNFYYGCRAFQNAGTNFATAGVAYPNQVTYNSLAFSPSDYGINLHT